MDLKEFKFPAVDKIDMVFPTFDTIPELLEEAKNRKFYNGRTPYNELFSQLFYHGGQVVFKSGIDEEYRKTVWQYIRSFIGSFAPLHNDKEAICAMLLSEICEEKMKVNA